MKKILLPLFIGFTAFSATAQIANGSFENWTNVHLFEHPYTGFSDMSSNYDTYFDNGALGVTKVQTDGNTVLRIENIMGSEAVMPGYFIFGKTPTDGLVFGGGKQVVDLNFTGLSMDLRYDMLEDSEGFIVVQFKDGNTPVGDGNYGVGTYVFPLTGSEDWTNKEFLFEYPIHPETDRCVIGIASGDLINNDMPYVLGSFIEVDNIKFMGSIDRIEGGNFESWYEVEPLKVPDECVVEIHPFNATYARTTEAYEGNFALRLRTIETDGNPNVGHILMGNRNENGDIVPNIEIGENEMLSFAYKYSATNDLGKARIVFYNETNSFEPVWEHVIELEPTAEYQLKEFSFGEVLQEMEISATHMSIEYYSSVATVDIPAQIASDLYIDGVQFPTSLSNQIVRFNSKTKAPSLKAYPNPTIGRVAITFPDRRSGFYQVYNNSGTQIAIREFEGTRQVGFDLGPYPSGTYVFKFVYKSGVQTIRVVKN